MTLLVVVFDWLMSERFVAMAHTLDGMKADGNVADRREAQGGRRKTDRFGLNMRRWAAQHESYIDTALMQGEAPQRLLDWHLRKLQWLQHERLSPVHHHRAIPDFARFCGTGTVHAARVAGGLSYSSCAFDLLSAPLLLLGEYRAALVSHRRGTA